jgi:hypothetical protein
VESDDADGGFDDMDFLMAMCQAADQAQVSAQATTTTTSVGTATPAPKAGLHQQPTTTRTAVAANFSLAHATSNMAQSHFTPQKVSTLSSSSSKAHNMQTSAIATTAAACVVKSSPASVPPTPRQTRAPVPLLQSVTCSEPGVKYARFKTSSVSKASDPATGAALLRLFASNRDKGLDAVVELRGQWAFTPVDKNMHFNIVWDAPPVGSSSSAAGYAAAAGGGALEERCQKRIIVDDEHNFFVLLPDILVSPSRIANASECMRKTVLGEKAVS